MLKWLLGRRRTAAPRAGERQRTAPSRRSAAPMPAAVTRPAPTVAPTVAALPEVVAEGNTQADWSAWEDSMIVWDSQMQDLVPSQRIYVRESRQAPAEDLDPFASVAGKRGR